MWIANEQERLFKTKYFWTLIAQKYLEGNVKSTLKKELKANIVAGREPVWDLRAIFCYIEFSMLSQNVT